MKNYMKGQSPMKFDEFTLILLGAVIFLGITAIALSTPGEFPPSTDPNEVTLTLYPGASADFNFKIAPKISEVNISTTGTISNWIYLSNSKFGLTREGVTVNVNIDVPNNVKTGIYNGTIIVRSKEGKTELKVSINIPETYQFDSQIIDLSNFDVEYLNETKTLVELENYVIKNNHLLDNKLILDNLRIESNQLKTIKEANIKFVVYTKENFGSIIVLQNGIEIFNENVGAGAVNIPLDISNLQQLNNIEITTTSPGLLFWTQNLYDTRNISVNLILEGNTEESIFNFELDKKYLNKLSKVQITYQIQNYDLEDNTSTELKIKLNNQTIHSRNPSLTTFNNIFEYDILEKPIKLLENNIIEFEFNEKAKYEIKDAKLIIFTGII